MNFVNTLSTISKWTLASRNAHKRDELIALLPEIEILPLPKDAPEPAETGETFAENALIKARSAAEFTGLPALADDSGLCVTALGGAPGIYSARYGSSDFIAYASRQGWEKNDLAPLPQNATDIDRVRLLLRQMESVPDGRRHAKFVCAIACVLPDGQSCVVQGECDGEIACQLEGNNGFGYDPVFYVPTYQRTFASLAPEIKNQISHRARALQKLKAMFQRV